MYDLKTEAVKLIDFGLAKRTANKLRKMRTIAGTPYFIAPEVIDGNYGRECDIWSLGVVLFMMVNGTYPFLGQNHTEVFKRIKEGKYNFKPEIAEKLSNDCIDLINLMLDTDSSNRITAE